MNRNELKGNWNQLKGKIKKSWSKLSDDEITKINGDYNELVGTVQKHYGYQQQKARDEVNKFLSQGE